MTPPSADDLLDRLRALPAGARLLAVLEPPDAEPTRGGRRAPRVTGPLPGVHLVGGAVRDLLLGREPAELDLVVEGDAEQVAWELGRRLQGAGRAHERFGTHTVEADGLRVDVAMARAERYPHPGGLPEVRAAPLAEDLLRRDFTANAIALGISPEIRGELAAAPSAFEDLAARRLRVLHERSFLDDPTRLLRLVRYAARLGFAIEGDTERIAREAFAAGAPATAGVARMGSELMLLLGEPVAVDALVLLRDLAGPGGLDPDLSIEPELLHRALSIVPSDARADLTLLAAAVRGAERDRLASWLAGMHLRREDAATVLDAAADPEELAAAMRAAERPSQLATLLRRRAPEAVALAGAQGAEAQAREWLGSLRRVRLRVTGSDLLAAGVPEGPGLGRRLDAALARKLDEGLASREDELAAALEAEA